MMFQVFIPILCMSPFQYSSHNNLLPGRNPSQPHSGCDIRNSSCNQRQGECREHEGILTSLHHVMHRHSLQTTALTLILPASMLCLLPSLLFHPLDVAPLQVIEGCVLKKHQSKAPNPHPRKIDRERTPPVAPAAGGAPAPHTKRPPAAGGGAGAAPPHTKRN
jgi:hypothetical protein